MRFENKSVVITGGSSGIGAAAVRVFAQEGAKVMISGRSEQRCRQICDEMASVGHRVEKFTGDLSEKSYCEQLIAHTAKTFGGLDILVNNAGIIPRGNILETTDQMWLDALNVNLTAVFYLCRAAIPLMMEITIH